MEPARAFGRIGGLLAVVCLASLLSACEEPRPRTYNDFMEDRFAREGALARCSESAEADLKDIECANARRAAATIALREERQRREAFELESERKLAALRDRIARQEQADRQAAEDKARAEREAYDAIWEDGDPAASAESIETSPVAAESIVAAPDADGEDGTVRLPAPESPQGHEAVSTPGGEVQPSDRLGLIQAPGVTTRGAGGEPDELSIPRPFRSSE